MPGAPVLVPHPELADAARALAGEFPELDGVGAALGEPIVA
jgi:hypothetical protein